MRRAKVLAKTTGMSREEWLAMRRQGVGGSDAPAICGLSRWGNPLSVYLDKTASRPPEEDEGNRFQYWGTVLEPVIADEFARQTGFKVRRRNAILQDPEYPFLLANIDREVLHPEYGLVGLECKNASQYKAKEWADDKTPTEYELQCLHYMMVTGAPRWYLAVLVGGNDFHMRLIERDEETIAFLRQIEVSFWEMVVARTPPAMDEQGQLVGMSFAVAEAGIVLPDVLAPKIALYQELDAQVKPLEKERDALKAELQQVMATASEEAEVFVCGDFKLSSKIVTTQRFDAKAFVRDQPEVAAGYMVAGRQRRFGVR